MASLVTLGVEAADQAAGRRRFHRKRSEIVTGNASTEHVIVHYTNEGERLAYRTLDGIEIQLPDPEKPWPRVRGKRNLVKAMLKLGSRPSSPCTPASPETSPKVSKTGKSDKRRNRRGGSGRSVSLAPASLPKSSKQTTAAVAAATPAAPAAAVTAGPAAGLAAPVRSAGARRRSSRTRRPARADAASQRDADEPRPPEQALEDDAFAFGDDAFALSEPVGPSASAAAATAAAAAAGADQQPQQQQHEPRRQEHILPQQQQWRPRAQQPEQRVDAQHYKVQQLLHNQPRHRPRKGSQRQQVEPPQAPAVTPAAAAAARPPRHSASTGQEEAQTVSFHATFHQRTSGTGVRRGSAAASATPSLSELVHAHRAANGVLVDEYGLPVIH